ncbi:MAG: hypothetical protein V4751_08350 [Pseudomonadota bacterium]
MKKLSTSLLWIAAGLSTSAAAHVDSLSMVPHSHSTVAYPVLLVLLGVWGVVMCAGVARWVGQSFTRYIP